MTQYFHGDLSQAEAEAVGEKEEEEEGLLVAP